MGIFKPTSKEDKEQKTLAERLGAIDEAHSQLSKIIRTKTDDSALKDYAKLLYVDAAIKELEGKIPQYTPTEPPKLDHLADKASVDALAVEVGRIEMPSLEGLATDGELAKLKRDLLRKINAIDVKEVDDSSGVLIKRSKGVTGWAVYYDALHTASNPLTVNNERKQLTCDGLGSLTNKAYLPRNVVDLWDGVGGKVLATGVGDCYTVRLQYNFTSLDNNAQLDVEFDIGGDSEVLILDETIVKAKGVGGIQRASVNKSIYSLDTFLENGCKIYINTTNEIDIYDVIVFVQKTYDASSQ